MTVSKSALGLVAMTLLSACSGSGFSGSKKTSSTRPTAAERGRKSLPETDASAAGKTGKTVAEGDANAAKPGGDIAPQPPAVAPKDTTVGGDICAGRTGTMRMLILDLKSGWFAGDGGDTFHNFTTSAQSCSAQVEIVYAHITRFIIEGNIASAKDAGAILSCLTPNSAFNRRTDPGTGSTTLTASPPLIENDCVVGDLSSFQQVWLLSGSEIDRTDLPVSAKLITSIGTRLSELAASGKPVGLFFGAGLGNTQHGNAIARMALPATFASSPPFAPGSNGELGTLPSPKFFRTSAGGAPLVPGSGSAPGTFNSSHALFAGLPSLADYQRSRAVATDVSSDPSAFGGGSSIELGVKMTDGSCFGDRIAHVGLEAAATDLCGQKVIAATVLPNGTRVVLDANMPRFYTTAPTAWFNRIVNYLAQAKK